MTVSSGFARIGSYYNMEIIMIKAIINTVMTTFILFCSFVHASEFIYYPANSTSDPQRKIIYKINDIDITDINNDTGLWSQGYAPQIPGVPLQNLSGSSFSGVIHQSDLNSQSICGVSHTWNWITGDSLFRQDVESSVLVPFTLNQETTFKINYLGYWNLIDRDFGDQLFSPQIFQIRAGLNGNGNQMVRYTGGASEYVTLPAGDYRLSTGISNNLTCHFPFCDKEMTGFYQFDMDIIDGTTADGTSELKPFLSDSILINEDIDLTFTDTNGAVTYRAESQTTTFTQNPSGWYELTFQSNTTVIPSDGSVIQSIQFPSNRPGVFLVHVEELLIGQFMANDVLNFNDHSNILGHLLIPGSNAEMGVASVQIAYRKASIETSINRCGYIDKLAIKLNFDETLVNFNSIASYVADPIFTGLFD